MSDSTDQFVPVDLPSKMAPYEEKEFFLRPLLTGEVKRLKPAILNGNAYGILDILAGAMKPLKPDDLTDGDMWFVAAWLRLNTFPRIPLAKDWACPECGHANTYNVSLSSMTLEELPDEYAEPVEFELITGRKLNLRLPRAGDARVIRTYLKKLKGGDPSQDDIDAAEVAIMIRRDGSLEDRIKFVDDELTAEELIDIDTFKSHFSHGLPTLVTDTCKGCGHVNNRVRMTFRVHDIIPLSGTRRRIDDSVQFGKAPESDTDGQD